MPLCEITHNYYIFTCSSKQLTKQIYVHDENMESVLNEHIHGETQFYESAKVSMTGINNRRLNEVFTIISSILFILFSYWNCLIKNCGCVHDITNTIQSVRPTLNMKKFTIIKKLCSINSKSITLSKYKSIFKLYWQNEINNYITFTPQLQ